MEVISLPAKPCALDNPEHSWKAKCLHPKHFLISTFDRAKLMASPVWSKICSSPISLYNPVFIKVSSGWLLRPDSSIVPPCL
jgi:hypothetical protein